MMIMLNTYFSLWEDNIQESDDERGDWGRWVLFSWMGCYSLFYIYYVLWFFNTQQCG